MHRASALAQSNPWAKEVLTFYSRILEFQQQIFEASGVPDRNFPSRAGELRGALDLNEAAGRFPALLAIVQECGPARLVEHGAGLCALAPEVIRQTLRQWLAEPNAEQNGSAFFARVVLEPQAERLARAVGGRKQGVAGNSCPVCESKPQMAVIRPEGDGGKRMLLCSLCHMEWEFRRILCPVCGEENHEKLPRYSAEGVTAVRVEACDTCRRYLKSVDMTVDGRAVPEVDEVATAPLDIWATEHNYRKIYINLMGF